MCGADAFPHVRPQRIAGSPPRVRSRPRRGANGLYGIGITSACAEQTSHCSTSALFNRDHLRVCGADPCDLDEGQHLSGSPPRVRSRRPGHLSHATRAGITSACAEQTMATMITPILHRDHLRVCGADRLDLGRAEQYEGSPPRVRSRPWPCACSFRPSRITSACAEQTHPHLRMGRQGRDHLRVCGADTFSLMLMPPLRGSPPRVRSRREP